MYGGVDGHNSNRYVDIVVVCVMLAHVKDCRYCGKALLKKGGEPPYLLRKKALWIYRRTFPDVQKGRNVPGLHGMGNDRRDG